MRLSHYFLPTLREVPSEAEVISHQLMLRAGMIKKLASGVFSFLPLGLRSLKKVENIIREEMNRTGAQEILMPVLQPAEIWKESQRWDDMKEVMWRLEDKNKRQFGLGPTHEEVITDIARHFMKSYRQLPLTLYQIQTKFRDEIRPRFGLMRSREFLMKDAYSFHTDAKDALREYDVMYKAYHQIFKRCGLLFRAVEADTGAMGGSASHEFQVLAQSGEDEILSCEVCQRSGNKDFLKQKEGDLCTTCKKGKIKSYRGIEVGHIFFLGNKYSQSMGAHYLNEKGEQVPIEMGCYGIGVGRTLAAAIEQHYDDHGIIWPITIAPFEVMIVPLNMSDEKIVQVAESLYRELSESGMEVLLHDRDERAGVKFNDSDLIGIPIRVAIGSKGIAKGEMGIKLRSEKNEKQISIQNATHHIKSVRDELIQKINSGA